MFFIESSLYTFASPDEMIHTKGIRLFMLHRADFADKTFPEAELNPTKNVHYSKQFRASPVNLQIPRDLTQTYRISYVWDLWEKLCFESVW